MEYSTKYIVGNKVKSCKFAFSSRDFAACEVKIRFYKSICADVLSIRIHIESSHILLLFGKAQIDPPESRNYMNITCTSIT